MSSEVTAWPTVEPTIAGGEVAVRVTLGCVGPRQEPASPTDPDADQHEDRPDDHQDDPANGRVVTFGRD